MRFTPWRNALLWVGTRSDWPRKTGRRVPELNFAGVTPTVLTHIGDYAKNIAKRVPQLENAGKIEPLSLLPEMARIATQMVHDVLDAFVERDSAMAVQVCERDSAVDDFYDSIFRALLTHMMENPQNIGQSAHLLFVAKNLERVGDHATNIAEMVYYAAVGEHMADRPKVTL